MFLSLTNLLTKGRSPTHPVLHDSEAVHWKDFSEEVYRRAECLQAQSAQRWLLWMESTAAFSTWLLALVMAGKTVVLPPNAQPGTLGIQLAQAYDARVDELPPQAWKNASGRCPPNRAAEARIELCTSGSTGQAKRISKTIAQLEAEIEVLDALWGKTLAEATIIATVPHHHIYGLLFRVLWPLSAGRLFDCALCAHPDTLQQRAAALGRTALVASPAQLSRLPMLMDLSLWRHAPSLIFSSGGALLPATAEEFKAQLGAAPIEVYGSTETGGIAWRRQDEDARWRPLPGVSLVATPEGASLRSPFLDEEGYLLEDILEFDGEGCFQLLGRADRIVKVEEKRLSLPELESNLASHPWVKQAAALVLEGSRQRVAVAVVLSDAGQNILREQGRRKLREHLRTHLSGFHDAVLLPRHWRYVDSLPWNAQGKLALQDLRELFS